MMNNSDVFDSLNLEIVDFGPILKAKLELRPLTVFVGPSNTGKSYLAILIYALHKFFNNDDSFFGQRLFLDPAIYEKSKKENISQEIIEWIETTFGQTKNLTAGNTIPIPDFLNDMTSSFIVRSSALNNTLEDELCRCFGTTKIGSLIRKENGNGAHVIVKKRYKSDFAMHNISISARKTALVTRILKVWKLNSTVDRNLNTLN